MLWCRDGAVMSGRVRQQWIRCNCRFARSKLHAFIFRIGGVNGAGGASTLMATIDLEVPVRSVAVGLSGGDVIDVDVRRGAGAAESP